jgi:DNA-3-methyladenine glycosylase
MNTACLEAGFFDRSPVAVARQLLGQRLVRMLDGQRLSGLITETEAYNGEEDLACHAKAGLTPRTKVMYGPPGCLYVYFTYGMHWMLNFVTGPGNFPSAVLLRGMIITEGAPVVAERRKGRPRSAWTDGPAKICQALDIDRRQNGVNLYAPHGEVWVEPGMSIPDAQVTITPRIGIDSVPEPWKSKPWRFLADARNFPS